MTDTAPNGKSSTMKSVWKFPINIVDSETLLLPKGAEILTVQLQHGSPYLWALVDPTAELTARHFRVAGTGHPIADDIAAYIGTFQVYEGSLIFHLFEVQP